MKKFLIPVVAFAAFLMVSCSKNPVEKGVSMIEDAITKVESAQTRDEIKQIKKDLDKDLRALDADKFLEGLDDEKEKIALVEAAVKADKAFNDACKKRKAELK